LAEGVGEQDLGELYAYGSVGSPESNQLRLTFIDEESRHDLMLLKFHPEHAAGLASACVRETAAAIGEPIGILGFPLGGSILFVNGLVSRIEATSLETTATITNGSSGSPVFDDGGKVIGIARAERKSGGQGADIYIIVPIKRAAKLLIQVEDSARSDCDLGWTAWMTSEEYSSEFDRQNARGNFPVKVEGKNDNGTSYYRGLFIRTPDSIDSWYSYSSQEPGKDEAIHQELTATGHERVWSQSFVDAGGIDRHQGVWIRTKTGEPFQLPN
jgi:hypothetical protein